VNSIIIFVAKYFFIISILLVASYWIRARASVKIELTWRLAVGGVLAFALAALAGHLYFDPRPFVTHHLIPLIPHSPDNGFPSDHVLLTAFLGFTMLLYSRTLGLALLVVAFLVGAARVAAHIHNPRDIVASFVIAALAVALTQLLSHLWNGRRTAKSH
jgi:undecaprenyl-diphosphatase